MGGQEGGERPVLHQDGCSRTGRGRGDPGSEAPRGPSCPNGGHERAGEYLEQGMEDPFHLGSGAPVQALQSVHPHVEDPRLRRVYHRTHPLERLQDIPRGGGKVCRIGFQEDQCGAESEGSRYAHPGVDSRTRRPLRYLEDLSALPGTSGCQKGHGRGVQLRRPDELQPQLEGGEPEAHGGA